MKSFVATVPEKLVFGAGKIKELSTYVEGMGTKALIVTGKSTRPEKTKLLNTIKEQLAFVNIESFVFAKVEENPKTTTCDAGSEMAKEKGCDLIIGVGGGSPMDAAKFIAMLAVDGGKAVDYIPGGKFADKSDGEIFCLPFVLITTTSGTGSETTPFAVVTNPENNQKPGTGHDFWYADVAIVDPELSLSLPKNSTINTGLDVFFHSFEALVCNDDNPFADIFAIKAIELVVENLQKCLDNLSDLEARSAMALANSFAGTAIALSGTFAIHGLGHSIGGHYNATHGAILSSIGPEIARYSWSGNVAKFAKAAVLLGADASKDEKTLAEGCGDTMAKFLAQFDMNIGCASLGVKEEDIKDLVDDAFFAMGGAMAASPVPMTKADAIGIITRAL
jgi:alcohol dehydrogenase